MKKVCVALGSRANYASIKSTMQSIKNSSNLQLQVVCFASAKSPKFGQLLQNIRNDGFEIDYEINSLLSNDDLESMAESTGLALLRLPSVLGRLNPDFVITVGDRFETMATAIAAAYMNICLVHTMGGEITGSIDESIRHAITKLSHIHFVATAKSRENVISLGEDSNFVFNTGCPRIDLAKKSLDISIDELQAKCELYGEGSKIDFSKPFILFSQHPVTTEFGSSGDQIYESLQALDQIDLPLVMLWPNSDAGSDSISKTIRTWQRNKKDSQIHFFRNLPPELYLRLMSLTSCLIGNSSSGLREGSFLGTPVINIGTRQISRERHKNVYDCLPKKENIRVAIEFQLQHGKYSQSLLYGDGLAGEKMASILSNTKIPSIQKILKPQ